MDDRKKAVAMAVLELDIGRWEYDEELKVRLGYNLHASHGIRPDLKFIVHLARSTTLRNASMVKRYRSIFNKQC